MMQRTTNDTIDWSRMDWNFGDSAESDSRVEHVGSSWSNEYWYGKAVFEFHLARSIYYESHKIGRNCDATLESMKRKYPYDECINRLKEVLDISYVEYVKDQQDDCSTLMCWIGTGCRIRGQSVEDKIAATLNHFISGQKNITLSLPASPPPSIQRNLSVGPSSRPPIVQDHTMNAKYSTLWKEWLDLRGAEPKYEETTLSYQPPQFKVSMTYRGQTFSGTGSRKRTAKHEAARQACQAFGIA